MRLIICLALLLLSVLPGTTVAAVIDREEAHERLAGEDYRYSIDFLVFRNLAEGRLRLVRDTVPGRYRAELEAKTLGVAAWLTGDRTQRYVAVMEAVGDGSLRSVSYQSSIIKRKHGEWTRRDKRFRFDYPAGKVYYDESDGGPFHKEREYPLPSGTTPVDMLTGFYNLRLGVYGALRPKAHLQIPTFTSRGTGTIDVEVMTDAALAAQPFFPQAGTLLRVRVSPEIFHTGNAGLYVFFDAGGRPTHGIVEDIIGMGDVYGYPQAPAHTSSTNNP